MTAWTIAIAVPIVGWLLADLWCALTGRTTFSETVTGWGRWSRLVPLALTLAMAVLAWHWWGV